MGSQVPPTGYNQQVPPYAVPPQRKSNTLLIVVVVVAAVVALVGILFVLLLTPNLTRAREAANEAAAMNSLRVIYQAEVQYQSMYPASGYACALANLGGAPGSQPSPSAAQLIPPDLARLKT